MFKKIRRISLLLILILVIIGCGSSKSPELDFEEKELKVNLGETFTLIPIISEVEDATPIEYAFDINGIVEHVSDNNFKAISTGIVEISANLKGYEDEKVAIKVTVIVEKYTVKFIDKDGKVLKTEEVEKGGTAIAPSAPEVSGYKFIGCHF